MTDVLEKVKTWFEGQDIFNDILDEVESFLAKLNVVNGSCYEENEDENI